MQRINDITFIDISTVTSEHDPMLLYKSRRAVQMNTVDLSPTQLLVWSFLLYHRERNEPREVGGNVYECELRKTNGIISTHNYAWLDEHMQELQDRKVTFALMDGDITPAKANMLSYFKLIRRGKRVFIVYEIPDGLVKEYYDRGMPPIDLVALTKLVGVKGAAQLYQNSKIFENEGETPQFPIAIFKQLLGCPSEQRFADFTRRTLRPSLMEVNKKSDINVKVQLIKDRNEVIAAKVLVNRKGLALPGFEEYPEPTATVDEWHHAMELLRKWKITPAGINEIIAHYQKSGHTEDDIVDRMNKVLIPYLERQGGKIGNAAGVIRNGLLEEWSKPPATQPAIKEKRTPSIPVVEPSTKANTGKTKQVIDAVSKWLDTIEQEDLEQLIAQFMAQVEPTQKKTLQATLTTKGVVSPMFCVPFSKFLAEIGVLSTA